MLILRMLRPDRRVRGLRDMGFETEEIGPSVIAADAEIKRRDWARQVSEIIGWPATSTRPDVQIQSLRYHRSEPRQRCALLAPVPARSQHLLGRCAFLVAYGGPPLPVPLVAIDERRDGHWRPFFHGRPGTPFVVWGGRYLVYGPPDRPPEARPPRVLLQRLTHLPAGLFSVIGIATDGRAVFVVSPDCHDLRTAWAAIADWR